MAKRRLASTAMLVRYGQSGWVCGWLVSIELSIARWIRIGIEIEISVYMNEHESAKTPSFHCSRQSLSRRRKVGSMPRSGGSTEFTYVDIARGPSQQSPCRDEQTADDTSAGACSSSCVS